MNISKLFSSVAIRDAIITALAVFAISAITGYVVYLSSAAGLKKEVQNNLVALAKSASGLINGDEHRQITKSDQKYSPLYEKVRAPFYPLLRANPNIAFIYTVIPVNDKIHFILDSKIIKAGEEDDTSGVMEEYTDATDVMKQALKQQKAMVEDEAYTDEWGTFLSGYAPIYDSKKEFVGIVGSDIRINDFLDALAKIRKSLYIGLVLAALASAACGFGVYYVRKMQAESEQKRKLQQEQIKRMEEFALAESERQKQESEIARKQAIYSMADDFEMAVKYVVSQIADSSEKMSLSASQMSNVANSTKDKSDIVSRFSDESAMNASQVAAAAEQLTASIKEISFQSGKSRKVAENATNKANEAKQNIEFLARKSGEVGAILDMINDIAEQINLLALNATIESARAGTAGKGFAVVASEVKNLADQVARATEEISKTIHEMQNSTNDSVNSVNDIMTIITEVANSASTVALAVEEQSMVTNEIARNITNTAEGTRKISESISEVKSGAEKTGSTSGAVYNSSVELSGYSKQLQSNIDTFLKTVRA